MGTKILFLVPYPLEISPSQRFRFEQYLPLLSNRGFQFKVSTFLQKDKGEIFSMPGNTIRKFRILVPAFLRRVKDMCRAPFYDIVFIHREAAPVGPPVFEWFLKFVLDKPIIYDFDDAIWLTDKTDEGALVRLVKCRNKVKSICRWSYKISCSNEFLADYASRFNKRVTVLPTTIDTISVHNRKLYAIEKDRSKITIGWTGSHSTLKYLKALETTIAEIEEENPRVTFLVIADRKPTLSIPSWHFIPWNPHTEIQDLLNIDIGVMPLPDDDWVKGKSGFKCLQYLALNIPAVVSDVGVNPKIIDHQKNGFLARNQNEWKTSLLALIKDKDLRERLGEEGQKKIEKRYSVAANSPVFLSLFQ